MAETIIKLVDRKGDAGRFVARSSTAPASSAVMTFLTGKTHCGANDYSTVTPGVLATPKVVIQTDVVENDVDYKAVISYKDLSIPSLPVTRKLVVDAPVLNQADGFCVVIESDKQAIPAIPPAGGVGKGGNTIVTEWETCLGVSAGTFRFISGGFIKTKS